MASETSQARSTLAKFCATDGVGMDIGYGGDACVPWAITFDLPSGPYCPSFEGHRQHLRGDCRKLDFICDNALSWIWSSHLIEDFTYGELIPIIKEWRRVLEPKGTLILNCPDQRRFLAHCHKTGQGINENHKEGDFSMRNFIDRVLVYAGDWEIVYQDPDVPPYSWYLVCAKI